MSKRVPGLGGGHGGARGKGMQTAHRLFGVELRKCVGGGLVDVRDLEAVERQRKVKEKAAEGQGKGSERSRERQRKVKGKAAKGQGKGGRGVGGTRRGCE